MSVQKFLFQHTLLRSHLSALERFSRPDAYQNVQARTLRALIQRARRTQFGTDHSFDTIRSVSDYQKQVPLRTYENFFSDYFLPASRAHAKKTGTFYDPENMAPYLKNVTWPGLIPFFSLSSGTTSGKTKFIPFTRELAAGNQNAVLGLLALHFSEHPASRALNGKTYFLSGNPSLRRFWQGQVACGDLSGILVERMPFFLRPFYFPGKKIAAIPGWEERIAQTVEAALGHSLTTLGGVPTWILLFLEALNRRVSIKGNIRKLWPEFELYIHGGISFAPYRDQFQEWFGSGPGFQEVYPASEGFIAVEDPRERALRLLVGGGIFYEFVPVEELSSKTPTRLTIWDAAVGPDYAVVLTNNAGLWSYVLGDTVRFLSKEPPLIQITGRTKYFLSAFGEHLIQEEIERALQETCSKFAASFVEYHVAPIFPDAEESKGGHHYLVEFIRPPADLEKFTDAFDGRLQKINEDYEAHRSGGFGLKRPQVTAVPVGFFREWMKLKGKLGGQHKVPRISGSREVLDSMLGLLAELGKL